MKQQDTDAIDVPGERAGALECPKERTRVRCRFNPSSGCLSPSSEVRVWHERCWNVSPWEDAGKRDEADIDSEWRHAVVGLDSFRSLGGKASKSDAQAGGASLALECGIELQGEPGVLKVVLHSGTGSRNGYEQICVRRSWVGEGARAGCSVFTEVEVLEDTTGDK